MPFKENKMAVEWMPMTVFVFIYVLLIRIAYTLISKTLDRICLKVSKLTSEEEALIEEMKRLVSEQQKINAQDEFPKYARLQRKIDLLKDSMKKYDSKRKKVIAKNKMVSKMTALGIILGVHFLFLLTYRKTPIAVLPQEWFYPVHTILSFPSGIPGAVGLPCWMFTCNKIIEKFVI